MTILAPIVRARNVNPATSANPRDAWPAWVDEDRWEPIPSDDDFRPTAGPDFIPTAEEEAEAVEMLDVDEPEPDWDALAEDTVNSDRVCLGCYAW